MFLCWLVIVIRINPIVTGNKQKAKVIYWQMLDINNQGQSLIVHLLKESQVETSGWTACH